MLVFDESEQGLRIRLCRKCTSYKNQKECEHCERYYLIRFKNCKDYYMEKWSNENDG